jgi:hypothetical protein
MNRQRPLGTQNNRSFFLLLNFFFLQILVLLIFNFFRILKQINFILFFLRIFIIFLNFFKTFNYLERLRQIILHKYDMIRHNTIKYDMIKHGTD